MSLRKFTRRALLVGSAAIAGGVAFGVYLGRRTPENPLARDLPEGAATFNPWVLIDASGVTLIAPHADKGQGVMSVQAALLAEEMDLDWGGFRVEFGDPAAAYWNTALGDDMLPFRPDDESWLANAGRDVADLAVKTLGMQITGGSTTVPDSFVKLREAGALARETLKAAAARRTGVARDDLRTESGAVLLRDGTRIAYADLAAEAASVNPVDMPALRAPAEWRLLGKPMQRLDMVAKSTGTARYSVDLTIEGMVHAAIRLSPFRSAVRSHDPSPALALNGVEKVLSIPGGLAVIGATSWHAMRGAEALRVEWEPPSYPASQTGHWQRLEQGFTKDRLDRVWRDDGDASAATQSSDAFRAEYRSPYVAHAPLEPLSAIVVIREDSAEAWSGHQVPREAQKAVAEAAGLAPEKVRFHNQLIGGSFGHRLEVDFIRNAAAIAAQMPGVPVKLTYSRQEDFATDFPRHIAIGRARGTVRARQVAAIDLEIAAPSVTRSQMGRLGLNVPGPDSQIPAGAWNAPYAVPDFRVRAYAVEGLAPVSSWRAVGANGGGFILESFLDELIHQAGADPLAERIRLASDPVTRAVLEAVGEMSGWRSAAGKGRGMGVAMVSSFGVPVAEVVEVTATERGIRIDNVWVACDCGPVLDPVNFENLVQGGVVFGLGAAMNCEITFADGAVVQRNYNAHEGMRLYQCPSIEVRALGNAEKIRGIGEPPVPPTAPALANAIFAATGQRLRQLPLHHQIDFL
ncbi:xanthine dehydrogenase family protein molybdopterin-binding subunit [Paracoccus aurantiacus]|uniref:Xanthine dehydrogenase family protein molybdopterin-binding subunit n=1 Tax=Paracoccus aurantiacus TaxID=2599412 RepID=A0A5C6S9N5_9RHOB|nr:molybdopterin cofactor-binding domain-containing protein [Paracoccus aurantiacus]TXB70443.1 xanthine dehydrogenase family protein molybdopterin-binding subunit [Paracoccus aurantiacus]